MMRMILAVLLLAASASVQAAPSVFVRAERGTAWWDGAINARILGTAAGPVTVKRLSDYLAETLIYYPYEVCTLEPVQIDTYVGIDRVTQSEIDAYRGQVRWRIDAVTPDGRKLLAQSVVFEGCASDDPRGAALLVTDAASGAILRWQPLGDRGDGVSAWVLFLTPSEGDDLFSFSGCTECGDRTYVYYDVTRRHIYTEHNGH